MWWALFWPSWLITQTERGNGLSSVLIMDANKTKAVIWPLHSNPLRGVFALPSSSWQWAWEKVQPAGAAKPEHALSSHDSTEFMMSARNQTSAQWQMHTASAGSVTNAIWQICPPSWLWDEEQMLLFLSQQAREMARAVLVSWKVTLTTQPLTT